METEALFFIAVLADLLILLLAFRMGKPYLIAAVIGSIVLANITVGKFVTVFGFDISVGVIPFAGIFLATDIFSEYYSPKDAYKTIRMGLLVLAMMIGFGWFISILTPTDYAVTASSAIDTVLRSAVRITAASLLVYFLINSFDVWWYEKIKSWFPSRRYLWLRNIGSTTVSQFFDSVLFMTLAFVGTISLPVLIELILVLYAAKVVVALLDTPFMYLAYFFRSADVNNKKVQEKTSQLLL